MSTGAFVITGGSRGLGKEIARQANASGFPVALIARGEGDLKKAREEIEKSGKKAKISTHSCDLTSEKETSQVFREIAKTHGSIRLLVNNAGTWTGGKRVEELSRQDVQSSLDLNFFSAFNATKETLGLHKEDSDLAIINVGATSSLQGWNDVSAFCIAKGALRSLSQSLAREVSPKGIHVAHIIIDGMIDNERTRKLNAKVPKNKFIDVKSIAGTILHVALQDKSCWTFEWDVRPFNESW